MVGLVLCEAQPLLDELDGSAPLVGDAFNQPEQIHGVASQSVDAVDVHLVARRGGVRYRKPYQTRHTYASMMLSAGEHPMWVARQMGHANATITLKTYARWMPEAGQGARSKAVEKFAPMLRFPADSLQKSSENSSK